MSVLTRRQFLRSTGQAGLALTLATAFPPSAQMAYAHNSYAPVPSESGGSVLDSPEFQKLVVNGVAPLWVAGQTVNSFAYHLKFMNLPPHMRGYFQRAGGDWKNLLQAKAVWETIPAQIRAGGPQETARFLSDKDWSHIIPRSQGGASTADNGIFELRLLNRIRGGRPMTPNAIAAARAVIRHDLIGSVVRQTTATMMTGAMAGILIGGLIICLECGLLYAEGAITWEQMVEKVIKATLFAGALSFIIVGLIVGLGLLFPALLLALVPVLFVLQIVSLVFLAQHAITLAKGYWDVLNESGMIKEAGEVLDKTETFMRDTVNATGSGVSAKMREWTGSLARWVGWKRAWSMARGLYERMGADKAWAWFAAKTELVGGHTSDLLSPLQEWGHIPDFDVGTPQFSLPQLDVPGLVLPEVRINIDEVKERIASVIYVDFRAALDTTSQLRNSLDKYIEGAAS